MLQEESELEEIVKLVGMDALGAGDRLKLEEARSIREDFLQQDAFSDTDSNTSFRKMVLMMKIILYYYDKGVEALERGASVEKLAVLPCRELIARFKFVEDGKIESAYETAVAAVDREMDEACRVSDSL